MENNIEFNVNKDNKTIQIKRDFSAPLPLVWKAHTSSELLDQWWAPKPWKARSKSMDFSEGGSWRYAMVSPEGDEHWGKVTYEKINTEESYTATDSFTDADGNTTGNLPSIHWFVQFHANGDKTQVETLMSFATAEDLETIISMGFKEGFTTAANGLDELLTTM